MLCCSSAVVCSSTDCMLSAKTQAWWKCILELRSRSACRAVSTRQSFASTLVTETAPQCLYFSQPHSLSTMRNLALRLRGFVRNSSSPAIWRTAVTQDCMHACMHAQDIHFVLCSTMLHQIGIATYEIKNQRGPVGSYNCVTAARITLGFSS